MALLPQTYNTADLPDTGGKTVCIPEGNYQAVIVDSEFKPTSKGDGQFLALKVVITQGQYANTEFTERLNIINPNPKAVEIAYKTLARISEAVGMTQTPNDSAHLHNKPIMIEIKNKVSDDWKNDKGETIKGKEQSEIKKYSPLPKVGGVGGFSAPANHTPSFVTQAQTSAPATPPWAK